MLSDLVLEGPDDLRSGLRGHPRPKIQKMPISSFRRQHSFMHLKKVSWAMEAVEVVEAVEAAEAVEATDKSGSN